MKSFMKIYTTKAKALKFNQGSFFETLVGFTNTEYGKRSFTSEKP